MRKFLVVLSSFLILATFACSKPGSTEVPKTTDETPAATSRIRVSREGSEASEPAIAATADGKFLIAYVEKDADGKGDLFVRSFDASKKLGEPARVNPEPGQVRSWYGDPPTMEVAPDGTIYVGWTSRYPDTAKGTLLFVSASRDGGATFDEPVKVHSDTAPASHGMHSLAVASDGRVIVAWLDERYLKAETAKVGASPFLAFFHHTPTPKAEAEPDAELYFSVSSDGGQTFAQDKRIDAQVCPCCKTSLAIAADGTIYLGYRKVYPGSLRHITVISSKDGQTFGEPAAVSDDRWKLEACPVSGPALQMDNGRLAVAWYSGGEAREHGMYLTHATNADAKTFDIPQVLDGFDGGGTPAWAGDQLLWSNDGNVRATTMTAPAANLGEGRNLAAAANVRGTVVAFVSTTESKKSVWLEVAK